MATFDHLQLNKCYNNYYNTNLITYSSLMSVEEKRKRRYNRVKQLIMVELL